MATKGWLAEQEHNKDGNSRITVDLIHSLTKRLACRLSTHFQNQKASQLSSYTLIILSSSNVPEPPTPFSHGPVPTFNSVLEAVRPLPSTNKDITQYKRDSPGNCSISTVYKERHILVHYQSATDEVIMLF